jgi:hypothetical protein
MFPKAEVIPVGRMGTMGAKKVARTLKMGRKSAVKGTVVGAAVVTAATVAVGSAPLAGALNVDQQVLTAGPLVNLLPALGVTSVGPIFIANVSGIGDITLTLQLAPIGYDSQNIYNTVNALPFQRRPALIGFRSVFDRVYSTSGATAGQFPAVLSSGIGTRNLIDAYRTQIASINGNTPGGYTPYQPGTVQLPNQTNQELLYLRNPLRPNGGIDARFAPLLNLFGVDTTLPTAGVKSNDAGTIKLNTGTVDLTWAYDTNSDFPVTLNPFSIVNSLIAGLPINLVGGVVLTGLTGPDGPTNATELGLNVAGVLGILNRLSGGVSDVTDGKAWYGTLLPNDLPILEPLRLPSRLINAVFGTDLGTPFADALQPAFTILVNTGYSDVVTPADIAADPSLANTYQPYDRTFLTSATPEPFLSVNPLTPAEWVQVPGDVVRALFTGFGDVFFPSAPATPPASVMPSLAPSAARTLGAAEVQPDVVADDVAAPDPASAVSARKARGAALRAPAAVNAPEAAEAANAPEAAEAANAAEGAESGDDAVRATAGKTRDASTPKRAARATARAAD